MIQSFEIKNFRCFKHLKSTTLRQFNVIAGESGSGKTALMESLFLLGGATPEIYLRLRNWRGLNAAISFQGTKDSYESLFRDMFHDFDQDKGALIDSADTKGGKRQVFISYDRKNEYSLPLEGGDTNAFLIDPIVFKWHVNQRVFSSSAEIKDGRFMITGSAPVAPLAYFNPINLSAQQNAASYSSLSRKFQGQRLMRAITPLFPDVTDLTLEMLAGDTVLYVANSLKERLPIADASGGINKFVSIALGILANPRGTILVDEIENGFYFENFGLIWRTLIDLCLENDVQMIVTTHSAEFLRAASISLEDEEVAKNFQYMRLEKQKGDQPNLARVPTRSYIHALENNLEIRK